MHTLTHIALRLGYRPKLLQCVSKKFQRGDFSGLSFDSMEDKKRMTPREYYFKLGTAMFGLAVPGIGYDTYRSRRIHTPYL